MVYVNDISHVDPEENAAVKKLIDNCETLYIN